MTTLKDVIDNFIIVTATRGSGTDLLINRPIGTFLEKTGWDKKTEIIENNKEGLSKCYNKFLTDKYKGKYILFVHDDLLISDLFFAEKIALAFDKYDIIGLAGSKTCNLESDVTAWHTMTERKDMVGEVSHTKDDKVWTTCFGPTDSRALVIDSLFIGVNVDIALEKGLKFDERFDFHHLDIDFSLEANKLKIKTGVFQLSVIHFGLGDSMQSERWKESSVKFKEKYK